jgi:hypothetical protein
MTPLNQLSQSYWDSSIFLNKNYVWSSGLIETTETDSVISLNPRKLDPMASLRPWDRNFANDYLENLGEYEAKRLYPLNQSSRGIVWWKKNRGSKISPSPPKGGGEGVAVIKKLGMKTAWHSHFTMNWVYKYRKKVSQSALHSTNILGGSCFFLHSLLSNISYRNWHARVYIYCTALLIAFYLFMSDVIYSWNNNLSTLPDSHLYVEQQCYGGRNWIWSPGLALDEAGLTGQQVSPSSTVLHASQHSTL